MNQILMDFFLTSAPEIIEPASVVDLNTYESVMPMLPQMLREFAALDALERKCVMREAAGHPFTFTFGAEAVCLGLRNEPTATTSS